MKLQSLLSQYTNQNLLNWCTKFQSDNKDIIFTDFNQQVKDDNKDTIIWTKKLYNPQRNDRFMELVKLEEKQKNSEKLKTTQLEINRLYNETNQEIFEKQKDVNEHNKRINYEQKNPKTFAEAAWAMANKRKIENHKQKSN